MWRQAVLEILRSRPWCQATVLGAAVSLGMSGAALAQNYDPNICPPGFYPAPYQNTQMCPPGATYSPNPYTPYPVAPYSGMPHPTGQYPSNQYPSTQYPSTQSQTSPYSSSPSTTSPGGQSSPSTGNSSSNQSSQSNSMNSQANTSPSTGSGQSNNSQSNNSPDSQSSLSQAMQRGGGDGGSSSQGSYAPNMIGDSLGRFGMIEFAGSALHTTDFIDPVTLTAVPFDFRETFTGNLAIPLARAPKIAENNSPRPRDRVSFAYNHFHNGYPGSITVIQDLNNINNPDEPTNLTNFIQNANFLAVNPGFEAYTPTRESRSISQSNERFTLGIEKTFFYGDMSLELRVPLVNQAEYNVYGNTQIPTNVVSGGVDDPTGNVALNFKQVLYDLYTPTFSGVFTWGAGVTFPTSEGATISFYQVGGNGILDGNEDVNNNGVLDPSEDTVRGTKFHVDDNAYHLTPFLGIMLARNDRFFLNAFAQLDVANDEITIRDPAQGRVGALRVQNLAHIDVGFGYYIFSNRNRRFLQGIAPIVEYHYTAELQDPSSASFSLSSPLNDPFFTTATDVVVNGSPERRNFENVTMGLHFDLNRFANMRLASVLPLGNDYNRQFDAEFAFQLDLTR